MTFFSHVSAVSIVYDFEICLTLSSSNISAIYVPVLLDFTQKEYVKLSAIDVHFLLC